MPSFTNNYTEPGTYVVIDDDISTDVNTGLLSVCIIGKGKETKTVANELLELIPPMETPVTPIIGQNYTVGTIIYYNDSYYKVVTDSSPKAVTPVVNGEYFPNEVLNFNSTNYIVIGNGGTIEAIEPEAGMTLSVGDIIVYNDGDNDNYYEVTTAGEVTTPIADWITANATISLTESDVISSWISDNAQEITEGVDDAIMSYWIATDTVPTQTHYNVWEPETKYVVGDFMYYNGVYYECKKDHISPAEVNINYLNSNWTIIHPEANYYSAQLQANIVTAPVEATDAYSSRVYKNSDREYFTVDNSVLLWKATDEMPSEGPDGKYKITVSYTVEKSSVDREPKSYMRLSSVYAAYGEPSAENTISAGAQIAEANGATVFYCIQPEVNETTGLIDAAGLSKALRQAQKINAYCILPMVSPFEIEDDATNSLTMDQIISMCKTHVENMSTTLERKERIAILANNAMVEEEDYDTAIETYKANAASASSPRIVYIAPSQVTVTLDTGTVAQANGMYAAAALAGIICNNNYTCGEPITGKTLANVTINDRYTREEKNILASYGCLVLEGAEGTSVAKIRHALSTSTGDYVKSEIKMTKIKDVVSNTLRLALDRAYINTRFIGAPTISEMTATVNTILSSFIANNDIRSYSNLVIAQDQNYPNQVNVSFRIYPTTDLNYILVTFGVSFQEA